MTSYYGGTAVSEFMYCKLWQNDPELYGLIQKERIRQNCVLELNAEENYIPHCIQECLGSALHNKSTDELPGQILPSSNQFVNEIESLAKAQALEIFNLTSEKWGCNVRSNSGSLAKFAVFMGLLEPHDRIMGLDPFHGGYYIYGDNVDKKISITSKFFETVPYKLDCDTGKFDYDRIKELAKLFKPKIIIAGSSSYSLPLNYEKFSEIAKEVNACLLSDISDIAGLVSAKLIPSPFPHSDIVVTATNGSLSGPRGGIIYFRKGVRGETDSEAEIIYDFEHRINQAVSSGLHDSPNYNVIVGIAVALSRVDLRKTSSYQRRVKNNAEELCKCLKDYKYKVWNDETQNHLLVIDLNTLGISAFQAQLLLEEILINCNVCMLPGDIYDERKEYPHGLKFGTLAITTRGIEVAHMKKIGEFIHNGLQLTIKTAEISGSSLEQFSNIMVKNPEISVKIDEARENHKYFMSMFPMP